MTKNWKAVRRSTRGKSAPRSVRISAPLWDRIVVLIKKDPQFAGTGIPVGRALATLLNERLLEREAALEARQGGTR